MKRRAPTDRPYLSLEVDDSIAMHDAEGQAGDALRSHFSPDERVDGAETRRDRRHASGGSSVGIPGTASQRGAGEHQCGEQ